MELSVYGYWLARARKRGRCDCANCQNCGGPGYHCQHEIVPGETYVSGELNDRAGGYGKDRYCLDCARARGLDVDGAESQRPMQALG